MGDNNNSIQIDKSAEGVMKTDICGLIFLLKNSRLDADDMVVSTIDSEAKKTTYLNTYKVKNTTSGSQILILDDDSVSFMDEFGDIVTDLSDLEAEDIADLMSFMYIELDELNMDAVYYIFPREFLDEEKDDRHYFMISQQDALARIRKGETVYLDKDNKGHFVEITEDSPVFIFNILEHGWAVAINPNEPLPPDNGLSWTKSVEEALAASELDKPDEDAFEDDNETKAIMMEIDKRLEELVKKIKARKSEQNRN